MSWIERRIPRRQQPQGAVRFSALAGDVASLLLPSVAFGDVLTLAAPSIYGTVDRLPGSDGMAIIPISSGGSDLSIPSGYRASYSDSITLVGAFRLPTGANGRIAISGSSMTIGLDGSDRLTAATYCYPSGIKTATGSVVDRSRLITFAAAWDAGAGVRLAQDGALYTAPDSSVETNGYHTGLTVGTAGRIELYMLAALRDRRSDSDLQALSRNPWALFAPRVRRSPVPASAPSGVPDITAVLAESILSDRVSYRATLNYA